MGLRQFGNWREEFLIIIIYVWTQPDSTKYTTNHLDRFFSFFCRHNCFILLNKLSFVNIIYNFKWAFKLWLCKMEVHYSLSVLFIRIRMASIKYTDSLPPMSLCTIYSVTQNKLNLVNQKLLIIIAKRSLPGNYFWVIIQYVFKVPWNKV